MRKIDMTGQRIGHLKVIAESPERYISQNGKEVVWICRCDCGKTTEVRGSELRKGHTKSCGCFKGDYCRKANTTHGGRYERLHSIWNSMKQRCRNPNDQKYKDYGGRGIEVCDEWADDYGIFRAWAYENGYVPDRGHDCSIDRIDNDGNYEPGNCRWTTAKVQANNQRPKRTKGE